MTLRGSSSRSTGSKNLYDEYDLDGKVIKIYGRVPARARPAIIKYNNLLVKYSNDKGVTQIQDIPDGELTDKILEVLPDLVPEETAEYIEEHMSGKAAPILEILPVSELFWWLVNGMPEMMEQQVVESSGKAKPGPKASSPGRPKKKTISKSVAS